jgi:hypothetical protein
MTFSNRGQIGWLYQQQLGHQPIAPAALAMTGGAGSNEFLLADFVDGFYLGVNGGKVYRQESHQQ